MAQRKDWGGNRGVPLRRRGRYGGWLAAGAVAAVVLSPTPAWAQPFGPGACGGACFYADNSTETFYYLGLTVASITSAEHGRSKLENTDMTTQLQTASYNGDTDIIVSDDYSASASWAWWWCSSMVSGSTTKCNQGHIFYNLNHPSNPPLGCQEVGHAVGLDHSTSTGSCMYQLSTSAASDFDAHDKGHINGQY